ncbi:hypothetical protein [Flavobacterium pedocola]
MKIPSLQNILLGNTFLGIEHFSFEEKEMYSAVVVEKKDEELTISHSELNSFGDGTSSRINKKTPCYLTINTNQILYKTVESVSEDKDKILIAAFPNLKKDEFYYEVWSHKDYSVVALARKIYIDKLADAYRELGYLICGIRLGICCLSEITAHTDNEQFQTNSQTVNLANQEQFISNTFENKANYYNLNGLTVKSNQLLAFSGILNFFTQSTKIKGNILIQNSTLQDKYLQESFFKKGILVSLGILLFLLLINFFAFDYYYSKTVEENEINTLNNDIVTNLDSLKKKVSEKEKLALTILKSSEDPSSVKINRLVKTVPNSILLNELVLNPLKKNIKENEEIIVQQNEILISGITKNNNEFTGWIDHLKKNEFVDSITIKQFGKNEDMETNFSILITIK